jgi:hypothetical protein
VAGRAPIRAADGPSPSKKISPRASRARKRQRVKM